MSKIFLASGISKTRTALPECLLPVVSDEPRTDYNAAKDEAKLVYGQVVTEVLRKTGACLCGCACCGCCVRRRLWDRARAPTTGHRGQPGSLSALQGAGSKAWTTRGA